LPAQPSRKYRLGGARDEAGDDRRLLQVCIKTLEIFNRRAPLRSGKRHRRIDGHV